MNYYTCPDCGANLDHSEKCTCKSKQRLTEDEIRLISFIRSAPAGFEDELLSFISKPSFDQSDLNRLYTAAGRADLCKPIKKTALSAATDKAVSIAINN